MTDDLNPVDGLSLADQEQADEYDEAQRKTMRQGLINARAAVNAWQRTGDRFATMSRDFKRPMLPTSAEEFYEMARPYPAAPDASLPDRVDLLGAGCRSLADDAYVLAGHYRRALKSLIADVTCAYGPAWRVELGLPDEFPTPMDDA